VLDVVGDGLAVGGAPRSGGVDRGSQLDELVGDAIGDVGTRRDAGIGPDHNAATAATGAGGGDERGRDDRRPRRHLSVLQTVIVRVAVLTHRKRDSGNC